MRAGGRWCVSPDKRDVAHIKRDMSPNKRDTRLEDDIILLKRETHLLIREM